MAKMIISESDIKRMVAESVRRVLSERIGDDFDYYDDTPDYHCSDIGGSGLIDDLLDEAGIFYEDDNGNMTEEWKMIEEYLHGFDYTISFDYEYTPDEWHSEVGAWERCGGYSIGDLKDDDGLKEDMKKIPDEALRNKLLGIYDKIIDIAYEHADDERFW